MGFPVYYRLLCNDHFSLKFEPYLNPRLASKLTNHIKVALLGSDEKIDSSIMRSCQLPNHLLAPKIKTQGAASKDPDAIAIRHISHNHYYRGPTSKQEEPSATASRQISHAPRRS